MGWGNGGVGEEGLAIDGWKKSRELAYVSGDTYCCIRPQAGLWEGRSYGRYQNFVEYSCISPFRFMVTVAADNLISWAKTHIKSHR